MTLRSILRPAPPIAAAVCAWLAQTPAQATTLATFVSGLGVDSGGCPSSAPCKTLTYALSQTTAGGTIVVRSTGVFDAVNIAKSVSIIADGVVALIQSHIACGSGQAAICIAPGATTVNLRGLTIDLQQANSTGIMVTNAGTLHVDKSLIRRTGQAGVSFVPASSGGALFMSNSTVADGGGVGFNLHPTSGDHELTFDNVHVESNNTIGMFIVAPSGVTLGATIHDSVIAGHNNEAIFADTVSTGSVVLMIKRSALVNNDAGLSVSDHTVARISNSTITGNQNGLVHLGASQIISDKTNKVDGNTTDGATTSTFSRQ